MALFYKFSKNYQFMKLFIASLIVFSTFVSVAFGQHAIYVNQAYAGKGRDGSINHPFTTLLEGQNAARKFIANSTDDVEIILRAGVYTLSKTFELNEQDACKDHQKMTFKTYPNEQVIVSGGKEIKNWKRVEGKNYFVATANPKDGFAPYFRQLFVNDRRVMQSKSDFVPVFSMLYDDPETPQIWDGYIVKTKAIKPYNRYSQIRIFQEGDFKHIEQMVNKIIPISDSESAIVMKQPFFMDWTKTYVYNNTNSIRIINALEELDEPGEFYLDQETHQVYYYPQRGEVMEQASIVAPTVETLVNVKGTEVHYLSNISFEGLTFKYGNWLAPNTREIGRSQADLYPNYTSIEGQFIAQFTEHLSIKNCSFLCHANAGIYLPSNNKSTLIEGNIFNDLTAAAILLGDNHSFKEKGLNDSVLISNNVVRNIGQDFFQASGIYANCTKNLSVIHNDVADVAYFGINQRYGGEKDNISESFSGNTVFSGNKVSDYGTAAKYGFGIGDEVAGLYIYGTKGATISENYVTYGGKNEFLEGSFRQDALGTNNVFSNNVSDAKPAKRSFSASIENTKDNVFFKNNYSNEKIEPVHEKVLFDNHHLELDAPKWSEAAQTIINNAGLQPNYQHLLKQQSTGVNIALKAKVKVSGNEKMLDSAKKLIDNDLFTSFSSNKMNQLAWVYLELDKLYTIDKVQLLPIYQSNDPLSRCFFEVQLSNDANFKQYQVFGGQNEIPFAYNASPQTKKVPLAYNPWEMYGNGVGGYKYLRVFGKRISFSEIRIYGHETIQKGKQLTYNDVDFEKTLNSEKILQPASTEWGSACYTRKPFTKGAEYWHSRWFPNHIKLSKLGDTLKIETPSGTAVFRGGLFGNEPIKMGLKFLKNSNTATHIIAFRGKSNLRAFNEQACYYLSFSPKEIKLYQVNSKGDATILLGSEAGLKGKLGEGVPMVNNIYETLETFVLYTENEPNGVRIKLSIAGNEVFNCLDNTIGQIRDAGYLNLRASKNSSFLLMDL